MSSDPMSSDPMSSGRPGQDQLTGARHRGGGTWLTVLRRLTGMGVAGSLALALLAGSCVLAAVAGPRQAQATAARALRQTLDAVQPLDRSIVVGSSWAVLNSAVNSGNAAALDLTRPDIDQLTTQLRRDFGTGPLRLTPRSTDWFGMNAGLYSVLTAPPSLDGLPGRVEVTYRYPLAGHLRLVAGRMPDTTLSPISTSTQVIYLVQVVVTAQTASRFGLRPGSQLPISSPENMELIGPMSGLPPTVRLDVTGIVQPTDPGSSFWGADPLLPAPGLDRTGGASVWEGAVIADPGEIDLIQQIFGESGLLFQWQLPAGPAGPHTQAQALASQVSQITNQTPRLTGRLAPMADALDVASGLAQPLAAFSQASADVNVLLWIVYAGLAVATIVTLLLAARMIAARRSVELTALRARGASLRQLFWLGTRSAAVACLPAAVLAWVLAVLLVPGAAPAGLAGWWPGVATLAFVVLGPGAIAAWRHRLPRRVNVRRRWRWLPRVVLEVTACAAAIGGITVFRTQSGATDLFVSAAPVLVAVPAVIVALRLYQVLLYGLARASAQRRGVIGFVGLARAAQAPVALALPAMTLVLALTVASFTGMVRAAVVHADTAMSWQVTGADVVVTSGPLGLSSAAVRAISAVPGVQHAASALVVPLAVSTGGQVVTAVAVDPASYAALAASTRGFARVRPALLSQQAGPGALPVLASAQAAAYLGGRGGTTTILPQQGLPALRVRVAGQLSSTPAVPGGGAFIVLPLAAIHGVNVPPLNMVLLTGPSIDLTRLNSVVQATTAATGTAAVSTRSQALRGLTQAPLQQGTFVLFTLAVVYAAALALAVMLLELALGATDRGLTTARLATMGLTEGQRIRLVALEVVPSIAASAVAAVACALTLPRLVAPAVNLSVFTHSPAAVPLRPDLGSFLLPLAALLVLAVIALAYEVRSGRAVASTMRA